MTCPPIEAGGTIIVSPGLQPAIKENRFAIAPEGTLISANLEQKTSATRLEAKTSIYSIASRPISYLSPGYPSDGRDPIPHDRKASALGFITFVAGFKLKQSFS